MPDDFKPSKGCALLIPSGTASNPDSKHLFIVLTNPCDGGFHLLVSVSSVKSGRAHDSTCLLKPGEHPFIERQSYVFYARPRQLGHTGIMRCVASGLYVLKELCAENMLERVRNGVGLSAMTPRWAKEYFRVNRNR